MEMLSSQLFLRVFIRINFFSFVPYPPESFFLFILVLLFYALGFLKCLMIPVSSPPVYE